MRTVLGLCRLALKDRSPEQLAFYLSEARALGLDVQQIVAQLQQEYPDSPLLADPERLTEPPST